MAYIHLFPKLITWTLQLRPKMWPQFVHFHKLITETHFKLICPHSPGVNYNLPTLQCCGLFHLRYSFLAYVLLQSPAFGLFAYICVSPACTLFLCFHTIPQKHSSLWLHLFGVKTSLPHCDSRQLHSRLRWSDYYFHK